MKSERDTGRSRNARLNQARQHCQTIFSLLTKFQGTTATTPYVDEAFWLTLRVASEQLLKAVHEANAYNNVMCGDTSDDDTPLYVTLEE